jgi:hypothetical protein
VRVKNPLRTLLFLSVGLILTTKLGFAQSFTISTTVTTKQQLTGGQTGTVTSTGTLNDSKGSDAITGTNTVSGTVEIDNYGTILQSATSGGGRAIRIYGSATNTDIINNYSTGLISAFSSDAIQVKVSGTVTITNYGTISAVGPEEGPGTTGNGDQGINMNILNNDGTTTPYAGVVNNYGTISAYEADALRPGNGNIINNYGLIKSTNGAGNTSSSDGIDLQQNNTGVTINNGNATSTGTIIGARHGITGGQQVDAYYTSANANSSNALYDQPFTLTISNTAGSIIKGNNGSGVNIDGVDGTEVVTINNAGLISGNGGTADGDGVDVDGLVIITNSGTIISQSSFDDTSEGVTVGGGTINNSGLIEGSVININGTNTATGRGITLAGIDHTEYNGVETDIPYQYIYGNTTVTNSGLIKGDSDSGIAMMGITNTTGTVFSISITNTGGGVIEGNSATHAVIDGSSAVTVDGTGAASLYAETVVNYGTIKADNATEKAISLGMGNNVVQILGGSASVIGDMSGALLTGTNTAALTIAPGSGNSFNYNYNITNFTSVEFGAGTTTLGGTVTYTTGLGYANTGTIDAGATVDLTAASGGFTNTGTLTIASGGIFNLDGQTINVGTLSNQGTINGGTVNTSLISGLTGGASYNKTGNSTIVMTGTYTYTGGTTVSGGKLAVNGSIAGNVMVQAGAELGGSGLIAGAIKGSGSVGPGNSPGILTAASTDPTGGLSYNFEFAQAGAPTWSMAAASGNDVLHLTATLAFTANGTTDAPLTSANAVNLYFAGVGLTYEGGFFVEGSTNTLAADIAGATFNYYLLDNTNGTVTYNGNKYDVLSSSQVTGSVLQITGANFGTGTVNGYTEQFVVAVPEPSTYVLMGFGVVLLLLVVRRGASKDRN